jgi:predicted ATPase
MHLSQINLFPESYPTREFYPYNLEILCNICTIPFQTPVTFFIGENGTGKSTLLKAIAHKCGAPDWKDTSRTPFRYNQYAETLPHYLELKWTKGRVPSSFFASDTFQNFAQLLDEWAAADPEMLNYFGGESLVTKSHGQCNLAFFQNRYRLKGLYLLDEPENALSPKRQIELLSILQETSREGVAQFIIATHSPILLALPGALIYSFDGNVIKTIPYETTDHYRIYKDFLNDPKKFFCDE